MTSRRRRDVATSNHEQVGRALGLLAGALGPFVERECKARFGDGWATTVGRGGRPACTTDVQSLLGVMADQWAPVFSRVLDRGHRAFVGELIEARKRWAHQDSFSTDDAYRAIDTAQRLAAAVAAPEQAQELKAMCDELDRRRFEERARAAQRRGATAAVEGQPKGGLPPWREVIAPHPDVTSGNFSQAEFAADLHEVWKGGASPEYQEPGEFFRRTFLTEGLRTLLTNAVRRWSGQGGEPVVELQTNFGGGKTHSMIALHHLAAGHAPSKLPGVEGMLSSAGLPAPAPVRTAVLVGQMIDPGREHTEPDGTVVRTLWGELAWQLGGREGYGLVEPSDRNATNPGEALKELFRRHAPCLVLIDEWVAYARNLYGIDRGLPAGSFDTQFTFAQALVEAARATPGALVVVSVPSSDIEVGGEGGRQALERLRNVIGRVELSWRPASSDEGFEIVRRRIFEEVPADKAPWRDAVVKEFYELYRSHRGDFPPECGEPDYLRRLAAAYPVHPELFRCLYEEWSALDKFQRTRGVLRLMAAVVRELWDREDRGLLILPGTVPVDTVSSELTRYLEEGWEPVIGTDVDGPNALPLRLDRENRMFGRYSAARRVARTVYLGSAPAQHAANKGLDARRVKLGCTQPDESPATFGDALRHLADQATYLYVDRDRHWFSLQPSVNRLAADRAALNFSDDIVDLEIKDRLRSATRAGQRGDFSVVHPAPSGPAEVPDEQEARLVVLGPEHPHVARAAESPALGEARRVLDNRSAGARLHRNMLVFLAPDKARLEELRQGVREYLAWKSVHDEREVLNLDAFQRRQAETKADQARQTLDQRVGETFIWLLVPSQDLESREVTWQESRVSGPDPLAVRASKKLKVEEGLITSYSGARLRMDLDRVPLWRDGRVTLRQLWGYYTQHLYLPRLRDAEVLLGAVRDGLSLLTWDPETFAYASRYDDATGRYVGLVAGQQAEVVLDTEAVLVEPAVAARQLAAERAERGGDGGRNGGGEGGHRTGGSGAGRDGGGDRPGPEPPVPKLPKRFYGRASLHPLRWVRDVNEIAEAVVGQLERAGAEVSITIEVEAKAAKGFSEEVRRTVSENARTLKFEAQDFEES
jgi:predicted AAA+ superfamily ATPase